MKRKERGVKRRKGRLGEERERGEMLEKKKEEKTTEQLSKK